MHIGAEIAFLILLIFLSAYTSCAETAITSLTHGRIVYLVNEHKRKRRALTHLLEEPNDLITALLLLNNLITVTAASVMTLIVVQLMPELSPGLQGTIATAVMTVSLLVFGEITPKNFAKHNAEWLTLLLINQIHFLARVLKPMVSLFRWIAFGIVRLFGIDLREKEPVTMSDEQIETLVDAGEESGLLGQTEGDMIRRILEFDELTVEQVMVPRPDVRAIEVATSLGAARALVAKDGHSRFPVYQGVPDNVVGTLHAKDLLREGAGSSRGLRDILRPAVYVPTSQPINVLLRELRRRKVHMAVVVDEFGGMAGIVTMEDILEPRHADSPHLGRRGHRGGRHGANRPEPRDGSGAGGRRRGDGERARPEPARRDGQGRRRSARRRSDAEGRAGDGPRGHIRARSRAAPRFR